MAKIADPEEVKIRRALRDRERLLNDFLSLLYRLGDDYDTGKYTPRKSEGTPLLKYPAGMKPIERGRFLWH